MLTKKQSILSFEEGLLRDIAGAETQLKTTWASLFQALSADHFDIPAIQTKTLELNQGIFRLMTLRTPLYGVDKTFIDSLYTSFGPQSPMALSLLIQWVNASYGENIGAKGHFNSFLVFNVFSGQKNFEQNPEFLKLFLQAVIQQLIPLTKLSKEEQSFQKVHPVFLRLQLVIGKIVIYQENKKNAPLVLNDINQILVSNNITDTSLWELGYNANGITQLVVNLKALGMLQDSQETLALASRAAAMLSLNPNDLYARLIQNPRSLITDEMVVDRFSIGQNTKKGSFNQTKYPGLSECHCLPAFSREPQNLRDKLEQLLVDVLSGMNKSSPRIAIIGSGNLLETAIICAKLSQKLGTQTFHLDLIDPCSFFHEFNPTLKSFVHLLSDMGFDLQLESTADKLYHGKPKQSEDFLRNSMLLIPHQGSLRGKLVIEFYENRIYSENDARRVLFKGYQTKGEASTQNSSNTHTLFYQGKPDVIYMCDLLEADLPPNELAISLDSALPKTHFIVLKKIPAEDGSNQYRSVIQHTEKNDDGSWKAVPVPSDWGPSFMPGFNASSSSSSASNSSMSHSNIGLSAKFF